MKLLSVLTELIGEEKQTVDALIAAPVTRVIKSEIMQFERRQEALETVSSQEPGAMMPRLRAIFRQETLRGAFKELC